jgi:hypothetical protein
MAAASTPVDVFPPVEETSPAHRNEVIFVVQLDDIQNDGAKSFLLHL